MANHQINITDNGTTTLATVGKWCDRNIDVNVNVETIEDIPAETAAAATDIASGKQAYVNGELITGTVYTIDINGLLSSANSVSSSGGYLYVRNDFDIEPMLFRKGTYININTSMDTFGDATAADVVAGKTFTSTAGLKVTGTIEEMARASTKEQAAVGISEADGKVALTGMFASDILFRKSSFVKLTTNSYTFGNATAEDVAAGKTFTSTAGLKVTGTATVATYENGDEVEY